MTEAVKKFLEVNYQLLDNDKNEFCHMAYNGLTRYQQKELMDILSEANIDIEEARENFARFNIAMTFETVERPTALNTLITRYFNGILGLDTDWFFHYILDNEQEWDNEIKLSNGVFIVLPVMH